MDAIELGRMLKVRRGELNMSQNKMAELLCISKSTYGRTERGQTPLTPAEWNLYRERVGLPPIPLNTIITRGKTPIELWMRYLWVFGIYAFWVSAEPKPGEEYKFINFVVGNIIALPIIYCIAWRYPPPNPFAKERLMWLRDSISSYWRFWRDWKNHNKKNGGRKK